MKAGFTLVLRPSAMKNEAGGVLCKIHVRNNLTCTPGWPTTTEIQQANILVGSTQHVQERWIGNCSLGQSTIGSRVSCLDSGLKCPPLHGWTLATGTLHVQHVPTPRGIGHSITLIDRNSCAVAPTSFHLRYPLLIKALIYIIPSHTPRLLIPAMDLEAGHN